MRTHMLVLSLLLVGRVTRAANPDRVVIRDLASPHWSEGSVLVHAPLAKVREWMTDYARWPERFPDIVSVEKVGTENGRTVVRSKSRILGREMTLRFVDSGPLMQTYEGNGPSVTVQGKTFFEVVSPAETRVTMQTAAEVHGALAVVATEGIQRSRAHRKLRADLEALLGLEKN